MRKPVKIVLTVLVVAITIGLLVFVPYLQITYPTRAAFYGWAGDTKFYDDEASVLDETEVKELRDLLQPGDIILTRFNGYISNLFIPGYWTHASLYIGSVGERSPYVTADLEKIIPDSTNIIEAISSGVVFAHLDKSTNADGIAVLRPHVSDDELASAMECAIQQMNKPYDYDFDCDTDSRIYCTELIYKSYQPHTEMATFSLFGRNYITADELYNYTVQNTSQGCSLRVVFMSVGD